MNWNGNSITHTGNQNNFTPVGGSWSGYYPGANGPVVNQMVGGTITP